MWGEGRTKKERGYTRGGGVGFRSCKERKAFIQGGKRRGRES